MTISNTETFMLVLALGLGAWPLALARAASARRSAAGTGSPNRVATRLVREELGGSGFNTKTINNQDKGDSISIIWYQLTRLFLHMIDRTKSSESTKCKPSLQREFGKDYRRTKQDN